MSAVFATSSFSVTVQATGEVDTLQTGDQRDSADAVVVQLAGSGLFTAAAPSAQTVSGDELGYLAQDPFGPDDPASS